MPKEQGSFASGSGETSPILHALRIPGDEVQFGAVLAELCAEPLVARAFATSVLGHVSRGNPQAHSALGSAQGEVRRSRERILGELPVGRRSLRGRAWWGGRTDLDLVGPDGWRLIVELKINAEIEPAQIERYLRDAPVAVLARRVKATEELARWERHVHWVGIATWSSVREDLYSLPLDDPFRSEWHRLLEVVERDGDFAETIGKRSAELEAAGAVLSEICSPLLDHVRSELVRTYRSRAEALVEGLRVFSVALYKPWASIDFGVTRSNWIVRLMLKDMFSRSPTLRVERSSSREVDGGWRRSAQRRHVERTLQGAGDWEISDSRPEFREPDAVRKWLCQQLTRLVEVGAFAVDLDL